MSPSVTRAWPLHSGSLWLRPWLRPRSNICFSTQDERRPFHGRVYSGQRLDAKEGTGLEGRKLAVTRLPPTQTCRRRRWRRAATRVRAGLCRLRGCLQDKPLCWLSTCASLLPVPFTASLAQAAPPPQSPSERHRGPARPAAGHLQHFHGHLCQEVSLGLTFGCRHPQAACFHGCNSRCQAPPSNACLVNKIGFL